MDVDDVTEILRSYYFDLLTEEEAIESLKEASSFDLYLAEIELLAEGFKEKEIKKIGKLYVDLIDGKSKELKRKLKKYHPIRQFIVEHEKIEAFLFKMDELSSELRYGSTDIDPVKIDAIMINLIEADKHFIREEKALFSQMKKLHNGGLVGRLGMLKDEHRQFRKQREELSNLVDDLDKNRDKIIEELDEMLYNLHLHKFIEDDMLYPVAVREIDDWNRVKKTADEIGYCDFVAIP